MKENDIIFAIISGFSVAWIAADFFGKYAWIFFIVLPILSIIGLWLTDLIGKKMFIVRQIGRFVLVGAFADVVDIKVFQFLFWLAPFSLFFKGISFLAAMAIKYWINKHWAFEKPEKDGIKKEMVYFFVVTLAGLTLNIVSFYYFSKIKTGIPTHLWTELCIIFAALVAAVWNFVGYKFLVFKK